MQHAKLQGDDLEYAVEAAIAACDGDLRATIRSLVISNSLLSTECDRLRQCTSAGYIRGQLNLIEWLKRLP